MNISMKEHWNEIYGALDVDDMLAKFLGEDFRLLEYFDHTYYMPSGKPRQYIYTLFQNSGKYGTI
jgi:hypothetical protein